MAIKVGCLGTMGEIKESLAQQFARLGYDFKMFPSIESVLALNGDQVLDLLIVNTMSEEDELSNSYWLLREKEETREMPILYLAEDVIFFEEGDEVSGSVDCVRSPFEPDEILMRINTQLRIARLSRELEKKNSDLTRLVESLSQKNEEIHVLLKETENLNAKLAELARTDELTGLYNRRYLSEKVSDEFTRSQRHGYPLGFLMLDLDYFKIINDTYGHQTGDETLKVVASAITSSLRTDDTVARYGGDEIAVILPYASKDGCVILGRRLRLLVEKATGESDALPRAITLSVGGATTLDVTESTRELIGKADEMLFIAKKGGGSRVVIFDPNSKPEPYLTDRPLDS